MKPSSKHHYIEGQMSLLGTFSRRFFIEPMHAYWHRGEYPAEEFRDIWNEVVHGRLKGIGTWCVWVIPG
jgi:hypothetical protein